MIKEGYGKYTLFNSAEGIGRSLIPGEGFPAFLENVSNAFRGCKIFELYEIHEVSIVWIAEENFE